jgi:hypothetical protein
VADFDQFVNLDSENEIRMFGPVRGTDFEAKLYTVVTPPHEPTWAPFLAEGFSNSHNSVEFPRTGSSGACWYSVLTAAKQRTSLSPLASWVVISFGTPQRNGRMACAPH